MAISDIINLRNPLNQNNPFQQNGVSAGVIPGSVQYQQANPVKTNLQQAYEEAMSKTTPSWVMALSNAIPSIAQIGALGATKGAFNQGYVADSLEREKQRQQAYNQYLQQQEQNKVKDFVAMAEKQMGIDRADEDRNYTREQARIKSAYDKMIADRDWENKLALQDQAREQQAIDNENKKQALELQRQKINAEINDLQNNPFKTAKQEQELEILKLQRKKLEQETDPNFLEQEKAKAETDERNKKNAENIKLADTYAGREEITPELNAAIKKNPKLGDYFISSGKYNNGSYVGNLANAATGGIAGKAFGIGKNTNKYTLDFAQIIKDMTGKEPTKKDIARLKKDLGLKDD